MEEALLKDMISERDKKISQLEGKIEELDEKMERATAELRNIRTSSSETKLVYRREIADLVKKRDETLMKIHTLEQEVRNQNGSLHGYAEILKEVAPESVDSSYVVRMQSQLCKAMHSMGILEHQLGIVNQISGESIKSSKDAITSIVDEKSKMELEVMNELMAIDGEKRKVEEGWKQKLEKEQLQVVELRKRLGEDRNAGSDEDNSDEESKEFDEEEMQEALTELKDVIAEIEEENAQQLETINKLKAQLAEIDKSKEDIVEPSESPSHEAPADVESLNEDPSQSSEDSAIGYLQSDKANEDLAVGYLQSDEESVNNDEEESSEGASTEDPANGFVQSDEESLNDNLNESVEEFPKEDFINAQSDQGSNPVRPDPVEIPESPANTTPTSADALSKQGSKFFLKKSPKDTPTIKETKHVPANWDPFADDV